MPMHAFIDESARRNVYILAAALVNPGDLGELRRVMMRRLLIPGAREVHFAKENHSRRRAGGSPHGLGHPQHAAWR
jgi:hypothetical protein